MKTATHTIREGTQYILENELEYQYEEITREGLMGDLFYLGVLGYQAQQEGFGGLMAAQMNAEYGTGLSVGTYGYQPWVRYVMGVPMALDAGGVHMDLDSVPSHLTAANGSQTRRSEAVHPIGMLKSLLESVVPEQQFSAEDEPAQGVSAVSAITMASEQGQKIFHITEDNLDEVLAQVSISAESRHDIRRGVLSHGMTATVHEAPITVPGWRGSGYILTHPETGAGSYMIDGGKNGGYLSAGESFAIGVLAGVIAALLAVLLAKLLVIIVPLLLANAKAAISVALFIHSINSLFDDISAALEQCRDGLLALIMIIVIVTVFVMLLVLDVIYSLISFASGKALEAVLPKPDFTGHC